MPDISKQDKELFEFTQDARRAYEATNAALQREHALVMSYYEGHGWAKIAGAYKGRMVWLETDGDPDSRMLRVANNISSKNVQRAAVATQPVRIDVDVMPPDRKAGIISAAQCQTYEDTINELIEASRFTQALADANFTRSVCGSAGIGWCMIPSVQRMPGEDGYVEVPDVQLEAEWFFVTELVLDPRCMERDLSKHEYVIRSKGWTIGKINRVFGQLLKDRGIKIDPDKLQTMDQLATLEIDINTQSQNRLFSAYKFESKTKGAIVHQIHRKRDNSGYGRFDLYDVLIELPNNATNLGNLGNKQYVRLTKDGENMSPFGGDGLPLAVIHGHRRSDSMWGIGDQKMLVDTQERENRNQTYLERQLQANSQKNWLIDLRTMGKDKSSDALRRRITNAVGGIITYESGMGQDKGNVPHLVTHPAPQGFILEQSDRHERQARENIHRAEGHFGELKTHTPDASLQRAMDEASQVLDMRVHETKVVTERMLMNGLATICKRVQEQSPATLSWLVSRGFDEIDLATLAQTDSNIPAYSIRVRDSSIRLRSYAAKKMDLDAAAQLQQIDAPTYRREMVELDTPLLQSDREFQSSFTRFAKMVLAGEEWQPIPLGQRSDDLIEAFRRALIDRAAAPEAKARLTRAIQGQMMMFKQEMALLQPQQAAPEQQQPTQADILEGAFSAVAEQVAGQGAAA